MKVLISIQEQQIIPQPRVSGEAPVMSQLVQETGKRCLIPRYEHTQSSKAEEGEMIDQIIHLASKKASNLA